MGFQEPAPRYASRKQAIAPAWWVVLVVVALVGWVWADKRFNQGAKGAEAEAKSAAAEESSGTSEPTPYTLDEAPAGQIVHLQQMLREAQRELVDQRDEIESLERQLEEAKADAEQHRRGLERAVAELDRIHQDLDNLEAAAQALTRPSTPSPPVERVRPLGAPFVTTSLNGYVVASGLVHNPTKYPARGTLEVSLVGSGGVIDTRGFLLSIGPGETERYDITFTNIFPTERLGAQAQWVESP